MLESLHELRDNFILISFTASEQSYADSILDFLEDLYCKWMFIKFRSANSKGNLFKQRLYRQNCVETPFGYIKDLRVIK